MKKIQDQLFSLSDDTYANFQVKLTPGIKREDVIGVRIPVLRQYSKSLTEEEKLTFLSELPHRYYDENILHSIILSSLKDIDQCIELTEKFLPYIDNWAVCDILSPKIFKKHTSALLSYITKWIDSSEPYTQRFGIEMLMSFYLDDKFKEEYHNLVTKVISDEYYVNMMIAWYLATALAKQWDATIPILQKGILSKWVQNKTIQKARESYRITKEQKEYLKELKK